MKAKGKMLSGVNEMGNSLVYHMTLHAFPISLSGTSRAQHTFCKPFLIMMCQSLLLINNYIYSYQSLHCNRIVKKC